MEECLFCNIIDGKIPCIKVYEDDNFLAFLDIHPISKGHTLIVPKKHYTNIFDIDSKVVLENYFPVIQKVSIAVKKALNADGINVGMNNGKIAGQVVMHPHVHIIPRFNSDGLRNWDKVIDMNSEELNKIGEKIRKEI